MFKNFGNLFLGLIFLIFFTLESESLIELKNLDYSNTELQKIREEIKVNLHISKGGSTGEELIPLRFVKYKIVQGDTYSKIQTKSMLDISTIQSLNSLTSAHDIQKDKTIYLCNMRGIYDNEELPNTEKSRERLAQKYQINQKLLIYDDVFRGEWFIPGQRMTIKELTFFTGQAFTLPLKETPEESFSLSKPVSGSTSSKWGKRIDPFTKKETFHGGMDIAAAKGADVFSSAAGTVVLAETKGGYGNLVVIKHDYGYETRYGHLDQILVEKGQKVKKKDLIGKVGSTGRSTGYHLHFEVIRNQKNQKPIFSGHL
ncbi:MAG: M23 family metallopeptidase [Spirochaetia bacterium]|nr:M23 family metallopeptidase [Spirochaetia bacterium]